MLYQEATGTDNYAQRNFSTAYVHMMLLAALTMMMDKTECVMLLNTPEVISSSDAIQSKTDSTWIYAEIILTQLLRRRTIASRRREKTKTFSKARSLNEGYMEFEVSLEDLTPLDGQRLDLWVEKWRRRSIGTTDSPLDILYELSIRLVSGF